MSEATARLKTTGMHCSSCSMLVDLTLGDLPGVVSTKTDHASGDTVVAYDPDAVGVDAIIDAIRSVGYDAEPVE
jgi:copper chaperone CopZ